MTKKKPTETRTHKRKDGLSNVESYRKKQRGALVSHRLQRFRQPEERVVLRGSRALREGYAGLLGATVHEDGINFAVYSRHARSIFLVLFESKDGPPSDIILLPARTGNVHHGFVEGLREGQLYGLRARGEFNPAKGLRFNENKLLIDPYARAFSGRFRHDGNILLPYDPGSPDKDFSYDDRDSVDAVPKCIAYQKMFDWEGDRRPRIPMAELILYEVHVKGFTAHPSSQVAHPGTYLGFVEKIPYLKELGVNAVELLPVQAKMPAENEGKDGMGNYWGYNTFGFFAPEAGYAAQAGAEVEEFKILVRELHKAGIEVILDVVYNHTAEGNEMGPSFSFKGLDNPGYYDLTGSGTEPSRYYHNHSGTGNCLDFGSPPVVRMALDSLRYWVQEMHVDGFRFDLATVQGRGFWKGFEARAPFFQALAQDPVLSNVKMIAEPWDCDCYEQGNFPTGWSEWNSKFRDNARRFVKGDAGQVNEFGWRLTGSADLFREDGRGPDSSINFITCHDGFTLNDLVSYNEKHNEANGEENRDGYNDNLSWNCGAEGETEDEDVLSLRRRQARNFMCLLLFSQGVPMIAHGDEILRTQGGNNNAYCQDNSLAWMDWGPFEKKRGKATEMETEKKARRGMFEFTRLALNLRKRIPVLMGKTFLEGKAGPTGIPDIKWYGPEGKSLDWGNGETRQAAFQLDGRDSRLYFIFNMDPVELEFILPILPEGRKWLRVADTALPEGEDFLAEGLEAPLIHPSAYKVTARSTVILKD